MTKAKMRIDFEAPQEIELAEMVEFIAQDIASGEESGTVDDGEAGSLSWEMRPIGGGVEVDRRQRLAAAALLMGFDLPQEMDQAARSMFEAAEACPGMTTGDLAPMGDQGRRHALEFAKRLVDEMLTELPTADPQ